MEIAGEKFNKKLYFLAVALLFGLFAFQLWLHAVRTSATVDEGAHILAGHRHLQCGDYGINPEHPPMLKMMSAAPLALLMLNEPPWECGSKITSKPDMFAYGTSFVVQNGIDRVVVPARLAASLMCLLLAVLVFLAAREMFGRPEALTALALLAFEPNLIAYGSLVLTDVAIAATVFAAVFALYRYCQKQSWRRLFVAGLVLGLMLAAKHSAVVFVPILLAVLLTDVALFRPEKSGLLHQIWRQAAAYAGIFLIAFAVLWGFYGFRYASIPERSDTISVADYIKENGRPEMIETLSAKTTDLINRAHLFPESYVLGMADVIAWGSRNTFALGKNYPTGQWWYFPLAFAVKTSVALLLLLPLGFALPFLAPEKRRAMLFLLALPLVFFGFAMTSSMTIGVRHILPIYGFFIVAAAAGAIWLARKFRFFKYVLLAILIFHVAAAIRVAPHYIGFANDFWGGNENTHRIFNDSNTEIGQNLKFINEYLKRENITDCWIAAFNHRELVEATLPCRVLPSGLRILVSQTLIEPVPPVIEGTVLVSNNELPPRGGGEYLPFTQQEAPIALIGGSTYVYRGRFEVPLASAMSRAYRSGQFLRMNQTEEAVAEGRAAVELAVGDPRTHLALGLALLRAGQKEEARLEFETTVELAKTNPAFRNAEVRARLETERLK